MLSKQVWTQLLLVMDDFCVVVVVWTFEAEVCT
jgi:hypothetical protein